MSDALSSGKDPIVPKRNEHFSSAHFCSVARSILWLGEQFHPGDQAGCINTMHTCKAASVCVQMYASTISLINTSHKLFFSHGFTWLGLSTRLGFSCLLTRALLEAIHTGLCCPPIYSHHGCVAAQLYVKTMAYLSLKAISMTSRIRNED